MQQDSVEACCGFGAVDRRLKRGARRGAELSVGYGEGHREGGGDHVVRQLEWCADGAGDVPAVHDVVDEVEADGHLAGKRCPRTEFG